MTLLTEARGLPIFLGSLSLRVTMGLTNRTYRLISGTHILCAHEMTAVTPASGKKQ